MKRITLLSLVSALTLVACEETPPTTTTPTTTGGPDLSTLVWEGGCGDVTMYAGSEDRSLILVFHHYDNLTEQSYDAGEPITVELEAAGRVELVQGHDVFDLYCNDVLDDEVVDRTWEAVSGTVTLTVAATGEQDPWATYADATLELDQVLLQADDEEDVLIDSMSWEAFVGWLPG